MKELSTILNKSLLHSQKNESEANVKAAHHTPHQNAEKLKLVNKLKEADNFISYLRNEMEKDFSSCTKTLDEICETQINILSNLQ